MADLVMSALSSLIPKLGKLLEEEYNLQTDVKQRIRKLTLELEGAELALRKVAQVPRDQLDEQVQLWTRHVREASYDMEDVLDTFLVRVQGPDSAERESWLKRHSEKMTNLLKKSKARRNISVDVKDIMIHLDEVTERCRRYKVDDIATRPSLTASTVDPRLAAMYTQVKNLIGIDKSRDELISKLTLSDTTMKIVSVVGVGGLGKTTLAKAVYDKLKFEYAVEEFVSQLPPTKPVPAAAGCSCSLAAGPVAAVKKKRSSSCFAFVSVGRNPNLQKVIQEILIKLDKKRYMAFNFLLLHEISQFIDELREFLLTNKRYFIVIDDLWEIDSWNTIKWAFDNDNNCGGRIVITTRKMEVATKADEVYKLQPLPDDSSRKLFYRRIYGDEGKYVHNQPDEISDDILKKCGGIPLAIITMASFLVGKPAELWSELYKSIGFGCKDNTNEADNIVTRILSLSYYDLPSHLRTCLLYLSAFPEDSVIPKDALVWKWIAEGFVHEKQGIRLFEIGEAYFNDLINRSMIEAVTEFDYDDSIIIGCCVHDMVLDFIRSMSREEFFFTVLDNGQGTQQQSNARRLAYQYMPIVHPGPAANHLAKVRSFIAHSCAIETCLSLSSFELLRVLAIEDCSPRGDCGMRIEHLRHLLHLRYLSLRNTRIDKISEEIGALRYLQTLDLRGSVILQLPSSISLPTQLVCLRISFKRQVAKVASVVERLTSLEELSIIFENPVVLQPRSWLAKALGSLRELRVLETIIFHGDDESEERYLLRHLPHLQKLQHLVIKYLCDRQHRPSWEEAGFVLPWHLRHLTVYGTKFHKLPSCINPSCLPNLSYLDLMLDDMDEQDLKILGRLPELRYLELRLKSTATISNVSDSEAGYFLKLRCCRLSNSMVLFLDNKEDKCISFHLWNGEDHISMPFDSYYYDPDDETPRPLEPSKLQHGTPFMPRLQILYFTVRKQALRDHRYCTALGLEYLSSLQEINFMFSVSGRLNVEEKIYQALRRAADAHPNRPPLHNRHWC